MDHLSWGTGLMAGLNGSLAFSRRYVFMRATFYALTLMVSVICAANIAEAEEISLSGYEWEVRIDPATLKLEASKADGEAILLSSGQKELGPVGSVRRSVSSAEWELVNKKISVKMALDADTLLVNIRSQGMGSFCWPVMEFSHADTALIWPYCEGRYIPLSDKRWQSFLTDEEWNTLEGLCMPFWGIQIGSQQVTFIATNRYNNKIEFQFLHSLALARFTHTFPASKKNWEYGFRIRLTKTQSPVAPARHFRNWLISNKEFVSFADKLKKTPKTERLLGAIHLYLWGDSLFTRHDVKRKSWRSFCQAIVDQAGSHGSSVGKRLKEFMAEDKWERVKNVSAMEYADKYSKSEIAGEISRLLVAPDFYDEDSWQSLQIPGEVKPLLARKVSTLSRLELSRMNSLLLKAAYPEFLLPVPEWGNGLSLKMLQALKSSGLDRVRCCLDGWSGAELRPEVARVADEMGYLFGTYDSFHSIHDPALKGTDSSWPTAQFDRELYEKGAIVRADGTPHRGFKQRGYLLSPQAARASVERRVRRNMANVPYNYYFIDCDAYGQVFDDYSPQHRSTQAQDAADRMDRLDWISETFGAVIGSEGGSSYAAPHFHVSEGTLTPAFGWGDKEMKDKKSKYYEGNYYPPDGPRIFVQPTVLKNSYKLFHYDPRFRLPLNEIVFHDSFVSTHHWGRGSLKFTNVRDTVALTEMLYLCPPSTI